MLLNSSRSTPETVVSGAGLGRRGFLRLSGVVGMSAAGAAALSACAGPTGKTSGGLGSTKTSLTQAINRTMPTLDNKLNQFDAQVTLQRAVHQSLTAIGPDLQVQNVLASSFVQTSPNVWTVTLRDGICYSDGSPVRVEDVAKALTMYQKIPGGFIQPQFSEFPTVHKVNEKTFTFNSKSPIVTLDRLMTNVLIMPAKTNVPKETDAPLGTGPFVISRHDRGAGTFTLTQNAKYWGAPPGLDTVNIRFIQDDSVRVAALRRGEIDVMDSVPPDSAKQLEKVPGVTLVRTPGTRLVQLFYNFRKPKSSPLADPKVREALTYAIDGESLIRDILLNSVGPVDGVVPQTLVDAASVGKYTHDPEKAKSMLGAAGVKNLKLTTIWETGEFFSDSAVMESITEMMSKIGVTMKLKEFQAGGNISAWRQGRGGDWDVLANGYGNQTGQALTDMVGMFAGTAAKEKTRDTFQGYVYPEITRVISQASAEANAATRTALLKKAQQMVWDTYPCIWAFVQNNVLAYRTGVRNLDLLGINSYDIAAVSVGG